MQGTLQTLSKEIEFVDYCMFSSIYEAMPKQENKKRAKTAL